MQAAILNTFMIMESELETMAPLVFFPQYPFVIPAASAIAKNK